MQGETPPSYIINLIKTSDNVIIVFLKQWSNGYVQGFFLFA